MPYYLAISLLRIQFTKRYSSSLCKNLKLETTQMPIASKLNLLRYINNYRVKKCNAYCVKEISVKV